MNIELRNKYRKAIEAVWTDEKMRDYCCKKADIVYPVRDHIAEVDKPSIKTDFCFGYGYCGVSTAEDMKDADNMVRHAQTREDYFLSENLRDLDGWIESLEGSDYVAYAVNSYQHDYGIVCIHFCHWYEAEQQKRWAEQSGSTFFELTPEERKQIADVYRMEKERFTKRLKTYLKRYGLSKVHSWSYLVD